MYHYVRPLQDTRFPEIKGLHLDDFKGQLAYLKKHHDFIDARQFAAACRDDGHLANESVLLTFDDGYSDHYSHVLPVLLANEATGIFFVPVQAILDGVVLDVNKIHFVLASAPIGAVKDAMEDELARHRSDGHQIAEDDELWERFAVPSRFDAAEVGYVKKLLQRELPPDIRSEVLRVLFARFVGCEEKVFARELYVSIDQLKMMVKCGMTIGSHGTEHLWMDRLEVTSQRREVELSLDFLQSIGVPEEDWMMAYPYGAYNSSLIEICRDLNCVAAFTTHVGLAEVNAGTRFELARLDTNDLPKSPNCELSHWTTIALAGQPRD